MEYKIEAVILSSREVKEFDRIYNIFSRERGRLKVMARGVRRSQARLASALEPITRSEVFLAKGRMLDKVIGAIICDQYGLIKNNLGKVLKIRKVFNLIEELIPEEESLEDFYCELVFFLNNATKANEEKLLLMQLALVWKMLKIGGYQAKIYHCGKCGKKLQMGLSFWFLPERGVICADCQKQVSGNKFVIGEESIKVLRIISQKKMKVVSKLIVSPIALGNLSILTKSLLENMLQRKVEL